ncbi:MAG: hypothetical protein WA843_01625, partial [Candidatus Saccharimonadales bacterium]
TAVSRVLVFSVSEVETYWANYDNQDRFGVYENTDVLQAALYYLSGQATNEACEFLVTFPR